MPAPVAPELPHETLWKVTNGMVAARALHVVASLGVADRIDADPVTAKTLADSLRVDVTALDRVLRLLVSHGVFVRRDGGYVHNEASRLLRSDHPTSMRAFSRMMGLPLLCAAFTNLEHAVATGKPGVEVAEPAGFWAYLDRHPEEARIFGEAMAAKARADVAAVVGAYDFGAFQRVVDVGGGRGHLLRAILERAPITRGVLFDLPAVVAAVDPPNDRLEMKGGDFFVDTLPTADAYVLMEVIHDWRDAEAVAILKAVRRAARPGAKVLVVEGVVPAEGDDARVHTLDVVMLAVTGGRERTAHDLAALLRAAELRFTRTVETGGPMQIVEATVP